MLVVLEMVHFSSMRVPGPTQHTKLRTCCKSLVRKHLEHPPYSRDLAPSSFQLSSHCFTCDEDIKPAITWLIQLGHVLYASGKDKLITCCDKYLKYLRGLRKKFVTGFFSVFFGQILPLI